MENTYDIFTDASFDDKLQLATYSVVVIMNSKRIQAFGKECKIKLNNSAECEIFAIFQAMTIIESNIIQDEAIKKVYLNTDSSDFKKE